MTYIYGFIFCGTLCMIGQLLYEKTKLSPGHITSLFVVLGALLDSFGIYDMFIEYAGAGASLPITSFGHLLMHGASKSMEVYGLFGVALGIFDLTSVGITSAILFAFIMAIIFHPKS